MMNKKLVLIPIILLVLGGVGFFMFRSRKANSGSENSPTPPPTPRPRVNLIDMKERPYVTLAPLGARNEIEFKVHNLPKAAEEVEVVLEYDRNKGILDAVLKNFAIDKTPYVNKLFMGSKSAGGHTTYHDDVVGGKLTMNFTGGKDAYALEVPWRYDDTQPRYSQFATSDLKFQLTLDQPWKTRKILVMQSPGLPAPVDSKLLAGPYLIRSDVSFPNTSGKLTIRLDDTSDSVKVLGFNGQSWQEFQATIDGRIVSAAVALVDAYIVVE